MSDIRFGASGFIGAAEWTRKRLAEFNVPQASGNRLSKAEALIRAVNDRTVAIVQNDDLTLQRVTDALWSILEQYIVVRALGTPGRVLGTPLVAKLQMMLSGADTEAGDRNSLARNTQFELYTGATLTMGDVQVRLGEPDLHVRYLDVEIGVAAKRVRSERQLMKRVRDAVDQIKRTGMPGIVAVNVDVLLKASGAGALDTERLDERLAVLTKIDDALADDQQVIGSLIFARDAVWQFSGRLPSFAFSIWHRFAPYAKAVDQRARAEEFWQRVRAKIDQRTAAL